MHHLSSYQRFYPGISDASRSPSFIYHGTPCHKCLACQNASFADLIKKSAHAASTIRRQVALRKNRRICGWSWPVAVGSSYCSRVTRSPDPLHCALNTNCTIRQYRPFLFINWSVVFALIVRYWMKLGIEWVECGVQRAASLFQTKCSQLWSH